MNSLRIYVASKYEDKERTRYVQKALKAMGHTITHDWTSVEEDSGLKVPLPPEFLEECAMKDFEGAATCDLLFLINHPKGKGCFTELGISLANGAQVVVVEPEVATNIFLNLPYIHKAATLDEGIAMVKDLETIFESNESYAKAVSREKILDEISDERIRQDAKWGEENHPNGTSESYAGQRDAYRDACDESAKRGECTWLAIAKEEFYEAAAEESDEKLRKELVQSAAVHVSWIECIDRRAKNKVTT